MPLGTVKTRTRAALRKLRERLARIWWRPMTPDDLDTLIAGAALGDLFEAEAAALERRMAADPSVLAQIEAARRALDQVALAAPAVRPPARLRAELLRQAHASLAPASRRRG
ncbi:MAG: hypothetical protein FJ029_06500, partial [Actinobacteria bacterium]|nr:hypothetical protein [Actinomycetota bacterium]